MFKRVDEGGLCWDSPSLSSSSEPGHTEVVTGLTHMQENAYSPREEY